MGGVDSGQAVRVDLTLPAQNESAGVARQVVSGIAEALGLNEQDTADLKLVTTEATSNAVRHGYESNGTGEEGLQMQPIEVSIRGDAAEIEILVRDNGVGFDPQATSDGSLRLGLPLIASIASRVELSAPEDGGVELRAVLSFDHGPEVRRDTVISEPAQLMGEAARVSLAGSEYLRPVLGRLIGVSAARAGLTVDQLTEGLMLSDALGARSLRDVWQNSIEVRMREIDGVSELSLGPLRAGGGERLIKGLEIPGVGSLRSLLDDVTVVEEQAPEGSEQAEFVRLRMPRA